ncbi:MAG: N-acetylmuramoyl-L-alanine amidase, partial [Verrucomicrobiota bacterium]
RLVVGPTGQSVVEGEEIEGVSSSGLEELIEAVEHDGWVVVIDPGHGGVDAGAVKGEVYEKMLNLNVAYHLEEALKAENIPVVLTRRDDDEVSLQSRVDFANKVPKCVFVSVHHNTAPKAEPKGVETYFCPNRPASVVRRQMAHFNVEDETAFKDQRSSLLAERVQAALCTMTGAADRGVKEQNFHVIRQTVGPSVLVECGFLTNDVESARLLHPDYQRKLGHGIAEGVLRFIEEAREDPHFGVVLPEVNGTEKQGEIAQSANSDP